MADISLPLGRADLVTRLGMRGKLSAVECMTPLSSSENPCDFYNRNNCLFPQEYEEWCVCKSRRAALAFSSSLSPVSRAVWLGFACSPGRGKLIEQCFPEIIQGLQLMRELCKAAGTSLKCSQLLPALGCSVVLQRPAAAFTSRVALAARELRGSFIAFSKIRVFYLTKPRLVG